MLKRTLQAPPQENGAIDGYTSELSRLLRPALPGEQADEIINEAQAHLYDRADALAVEKKLTHAEAEARAVAAFTPAVRFAREMAQSAFETVHSKAWRTMGGALALATLCGLIALLVLADNFNFPFTFASPVALQVFFVLSSLILLCSYQARRARTRLFAVGTALATLFVFFYTGFYYVDGTRDEIWTRGNRTGIRRAYHYFRDARRNRQEDLARLEAGLKAFQAKDASTISAGLRGNSGQGYIVPSVYDARRGGDAFPALGNHTVISLAEARARWQTDGPRWIARDKQIVSVSRHYEAPFLTALEQQGWAKTAWWYALVTAGFGAWIVTLDCLFAKIGRANFTKRRARRTQRA